ncbi:hypothetical protein GQ44DRAFT_161043 [Phaeosphaeriaceae sp. PMI808]|nr:hypothetical protein GQ44DRAFT_161043 [Phaeosphaeriaceae sp. PMI808]
MTSAFAPSVATHSFLLLSFSAASAELVWTMMSPLLSCLAAVTWLASSMVFSLCLSKLADRVSSHPGFRVTPQKSATHLKTVLSQQPPYQNG